MNQHLGRRLALTLLVGIWAALLVACGMRTNPPTGGTVPQTPAPDPVKPIEPNPPIKVEPVPTKGETPPTKAKVTEDPEVVKALEAKGWKFKTDTLRGSDEPVVSLQLDDTDKLPEDRKIPLDDYKLIARTRTVQSLSLVSVAVTDEGLAIVGQMPGLLKFDLYSDAVTDAGLKSLAGCRTLQIVDLQGDAMTDAGLAELASLPGLSELRVRSCAGDGAGFARFAGAKKLRILDIGFLKELTDENVKHLARIPNLEELHIYVLAGSSKLTSAGLRAMVETRLPPIFNCNAEMIDDDLLISLVKRGWLYGPSPPGKSTGKPTTAAEVSAIDLHNHPITDKGITAILECVNVKSLRLSGPGITDVTLKRLAVFKKLESLFITQTDMTGEGFADLTGLPIQQLLLEGFTFKEDAFKSLGKLATLRKLWMGGSELEGDWLKHLAPLQKLDALSVEGAAFGDADVKHVLALPAIEELRVSNTELTDVGLAQLLKAPKLKYLHVRKTKVTKAACLKAKKDYPKVNLYFDEDAE